MKKLFTLFVLVLMALAVKAQTPLYTITTKLAADAEWGDDYAPYFAFQGTEVNVEVYAEDYVIIKNWAGAEGCDLKVEYDPNIDIDDEDCMGNILALTTIINGVEQEPYTYSKEVADEDETVYTVNYVDIATGRADYPVCSTSLNEDGTVYWSFIEVDKEAQTGYVELSAYFMNKDYDTEDIAGYYYYVSWPEAAAPGFYNTFTNGETGAVLDEDGNVDTAWGTAFLTDLTNITVDVYDQYILIHDYCKNPASPRDLKVTCSHDENQNLTSLTYINGDNETVIASAGNIYTGFSSADGESYMTGAYVYTNGYSLADWDEEGGYAIIVGYPYYKDAEGKSSTGALGYYYIYWGYDEENAIAAIKANAAGKGIFNLAGQKVDAAYKGIIVRDGKKMLQK